MTYGIWSDLAQADSVHSMHPLSGYTALVAGYVVEISCGRLAHPRRGGG